MKKDIILAGVGGQGILTIATIIAQTALKAGLNVRQPEVHGMSQRGGAVEAHLRLSSGQIYSDLIAPGTADLIISVEPMEALRHLDSLSPTGIIISNAKPIININDYPEVEKIIAAIEAVKGSKVIDADKIAVMGFSAGGHLTATLGTMWNSPILTEAFGMESETFKPNAIILSHPVISSGACAHRGSFDQLLGEDADAQLLHDLSLENAVGPHVPQTFIWHTLGDTTVPCENTLLFANELRKHSVPFELHIFPEGRHGLGLATVETAPPSMLDEYVLPHTAQWFTLCCNWLVTRFK